MVQKETQNTTRRITLEANEWKYRAAQQRRART